MSNYPPRYDETEEQEFSAMYQGLKVKVITSFRTHNAIVLIEDKNGGIYEIFKSHLSKI